MPIGRPSDYSDAVADKICEELMLGESLRAICAREDMPSERAVYNWLLKNEDFVQKYTRAREIQSERGIDEIIEIADDGTNDWIEKRNESGQIVGYVENGEAIRRSALRIDARKWKASKLLAKKYGDRASLEHTGKDGGPLSVTIVKYGDDTPA
jgi:hypothetical protein